ncbi:MAG: hypothetical protein QGI21_05165 [Candidatus Poseidoniaceae archaeon]|jgi:hypothetical protein|nr:hypothetical protein [Candidatus Poseidoniaceae archaeon]
MKQRRKIADKVLETLCASLVESLEKGCEHWPLPNPPLVDPDFPPIPPKDYRSLPEKGLALLRADRGMFDRHLTIVVDLIVPHRMNLTDDPFEVYERWLLRRLDILTERLQFAIATEWLSQALDRSSPDTERWWLAVALINGLSTKSYGQPVHQGYHLVESIALGEKPGTWHTQPEATNANIDWNPLAVTPRSTSVIAHKAGSDAANWLLERLEEGPEERRKLLIEWVRLLLERKELIGPLNLSKILLRRASDSSPEIVSKVALCIAKLLESDPDSGKDCIRIIHANRETLVRRTMADILTRLFRRIGEGAIPLLEDMLSDDDESVLAAASATVGDLKYIDSNLWANKIRELCDHKSAIVRRNLVYTIRDYLEEFHEDSRGIIPLLWADGDEVILTRLKELLIRMEEVNTERFASTLSKIKHLELETLWSPMAIKDNERTKAWKDWLSEKGPRPKDNPKPEIHISNKTVGDLPQLDEALSKLDDLGFLD